MEMSVGFINLMALRIVYYASQFKPWLLDLL